RSRSGRCGRQPRRRVLGGNPDVPRLPRLFRHLTRRIRFHGRFRRRRDQGGSNHFRWRRPLSCRQPRLQLSERGEALFQLPALDAESDVNNIWGAYFEDDGTQLPISRAERLDTKHGVQGAVGRIAKAPTDPYQTICTGTLISPVHDLPRSIRIQHVTPGNLYIIFPQEPGMAFQEDPSAPRQYLTSIPAGFDPEVAIFTLSEPVPKDIVRNYPRFNVE